MKILWVTNVPIPRIANDMGLQAPNICGWLTGFANSIEQRKDIELHICFPLLAIKKVICGSIEKISYYAFSQPKVMRILPAEDQLHTSNEMEKHIKEIIEKVKPDILHIFGTEYPHSLVATKTFGRPERTVVNIQGLTSFYWMHYNSGIPYKELKRFTLSNIARGNLLSQAKKLKMRGEFEVEILKKVGHVIGRTDWDESCTTQINPHVKYHFCNESLRDSFYNDIWDHSTCLKHSIFISQASTPIKGLQFMIRAMPEVLRVYPNAKLYIAGNNFVRSDSLYDRLKQSSFAKYIIRLISHSGIQNAVEFLGPLSELKMKEMYLKSHVFVSASTIENSPNSLGEAMILGLPCISSDVGGVKNLLEHGKEGFVYQSDAPYMLAYYIKKIFSDVELSKNLGNAAREHALKTHNREHNLKTLVSIYEEIYCVRKNKKTKS